MMKHVPGRVVVKADVDGKNWHTFASGQRIRIERQYNNLDRKHTEQVLGEVVSAEGMPAGAMVLFHHNAIHPSNLITANTQLSGTEIASGIRFFSFKEDECYLWKMPGEQEWNPAKNFATAYYLFEPYAGPLIGMQPKKLTDILYIAKGGRYEGYACNVLKAAGMPIVFINEGGVEEIIIRLRTFTEYSEREEIAAINEDITNKVKAGKILVGTSIRDCKTLKETINEK